MRTMSGCILAVVLLANVVFGTEPAKSGSAFADVYGAFAPLAVLHRSYADYLFYGTDVVVPDTLASACDETGYLLATLHFDLFVQTGAEILAAMPWLTRLRADVAVFCDSRSQILLSIAAGDFPDMDLLKEVSDLGLFSDIYRLQGGLQSVFEAYLEELSDEQDIWNFSVAFSLRTLLRQLSLERIEPGLRAILYGSDDAVGPPPFVSEVISDVIEHLVALIDVDLDTESKEEVHSLAQAIYEYVVEET